MSQPDVKKFKGEKPKTKLKPFQRVPYVLVMEILKRMEQQVKVSDFKDDTKFYGRFKLDPERRSINMFPSIELIFADMAINRVIGFQKTTESIKIVFNGYDLSALSRVRWFYTWFDKLKENLMKTQPKITTIRYELTSPFSYQRVADAVIELVECTAVYFPKLKNFRLHFFTPISPDKLFFILPSTVKRLYIKYPGKLHFGNVSKKDYVEKYSHLKDYLDKTDDDDDDYIPSWLRQKSVRKILIGTNFDDNFYMNIFNKELELLILINSSKKRVDLIISQLHKLTKLRIQNFYLVGFDILEEEKKDPDASEIPNVVDISLVLTTGYFDFGKLRNTSLKQVAVEGEVSRNIKKELYLSSWRRAGEDKMVINNFERVEHVDTIILQNTNLEMHNTLSVGECDIIADKLENISINVQSLDVLFLEKFSGTLFIGTPVKKVVQVTDCQITPYFEDNERKMEKWFNVFNHNMFSEIDQLFVIGTKFFYQWDDDNFHVPLVITSENLKDLSIKEFEGVISVKHIVTGSLVLVNTTIRTQHKLWIMQNLFNNVKSIVLGNFQLIKIKSPELFNQNSDTKVVSYPSVRKRIPLIISNDKLEHLTIEDFTKHNLVIEKNVKAFVLFKNVICMVRLEYSLRGRMALLDSTLLTPTPSKLMHNMFDTVSTFSIKNSVIIKSTLVKSHSPAGEAWIWRVNNQSLHTCAFGYTPNYLHKEVHLNKIKIKSDSTLILLNCKIIGGCPNLTYGVYVRDCTVGFECFKQLIKNVTVKGVWSLPLSTQTMATINGKVTVQFKVKVQGSTKEFIFYVKLNTKSIVHVVKRENVVEAVESLLKGQKIEKVEMTFDENTYVGAIMGM